MGVKAALMSRVPPIAPENQTITMNAEHSDESKALKLGKKAFEAALEAGFDLNLLYIL